MADFDFGNFLVEWLLAGIGREPDDLILHNAEGWVNVGKITQENYDNIQAAIIASHPPVDEEMIESEFLENEGTGEYTNGEL